MKLFFVSVPLFLTSVLTSQVLSNYGLKVGLTLSSAKYETTNRFYTDDYRDSRLGNSIGLFADFAISEIFLFQFDMSYSSEGAEDKIPITTSENPDGTGEFMIWDHEFNFLNTKLYLKPTYDTESIKLYGLLGPEIKILLSERDISLYNKNPKDFLFGYSLGFGLLPKGIFNGKIFIEFRFSDSFADIINTKDFKLGFKSLQLNLGCNVN